MNKVDQLKMFLGALSSGKAQSLAEAVERQKLADPKGLPADDILEGLRPKLREGGRGQKRVPTAQRFFVEVFEGLIVDDDGTAKRAARISRSSITPIWSWLISEQGGRLRDQADAVSQAILANDQEQLQEAINVLDKSAAAAISQAISKAGESGKAAKRLVAALGSEVVYEDLREVGRCLQIAPEVRQLRRELDVALDDLDEPQMSLIRQVYAATSERAPGSVPYLVLSLLPRFSQPWSVFGLAGDLRQASDDQDVKNSDLALVGERLVTDIEVYAAEMAVLRAADYDPEEAGRRLSAFALLQAGMTKELGMRRVGAWGTRLLKARGKVSSAMEKLFARMLKDFEQVFPVAKAPSAAKSGPRIADVSSMPDQAAIERAVKLARFLALARDYSGNLGFSVAFNETRNDVTKYIEEYGWLLVDAVAHAPDPNDPILDRYVEAAATAAEPLFSEEAIATIMRRLTNAKKRDSASAAG